MFNEKAAKAALGGYINGKRPPMKRRRYYELVTEKHNPDLEDDFTDCIADLLLLAESLGYDPLKRLSAAVSHVPSLSDAHYAIGRVIAAKGA